MEPGPTICLIVGQAGGVAKYDRLFEFLCRSADQPVTMTFDEIEQLVGPLPKSASTDSGWWANDASGGARHAQAKAWLNAGREATADRRRRTVTFGAATWLRGA